MFRYLLILCLVTTLLFPLSQCKQGQLQLSKNIQKVDLTEYSNVEVVKSFSRINNKIVEPKKPFINSTIDSINDIQTDDSKATLQEIQNLGFWSIRNNFYLIGVIIFVILMLFMFYFVKDSVGRLQQRIETVQLMEDENAKWIVTKL